MKIPFDIKYRPQIESGEYKLYCHGCNIRIVCWDADEYLPLVVIINGTAHQLTIDCIDEKDTKFDLFIVTPESELTEFEEGVRQVVVSALSGETSNGSGGTMSWAVVLSDDDVKKLAPRLLELAKKELLSYADENNPAIEAIADLERTYFCNPDKLPKWLKDDIEIKELKAHANGYDKGYENARKEYEKSTTYHYPIYQPMCFHGGVCTNPMRDCINCPMHSSGATTNTTTSGTCKKD